MVNASLCDLSCKIERCAHGTVCRSTSVSSPGETMPRSDSADSQSQAIQEEPLPSTSNEDEDPLAGKNPYPTTYHFLSLEQVFLKSSF